MSDKPVGTDAPAVREAGGADLAAFEPLLIAELGAAASGFLAPGWLGGRGRCGWVGSVAGVPAGCLVAAEVAETLEIFAIVVAPDRRRRGLAAAMVRAACRHGAGLGATEVILEVRASNVEARAFYQSLDFLVVGKRPSYYPDGEDALLLRRVLDHADEAAGSARDPQP